MATPIPSTYLKNPDKAQAERKWHVIDVAGLTLGRAATQIATLLRGKHKTDYTPNIDSGDFVVVLNAQKVHLTGKKLDDNGGKSEGKDKNRNKDKGKDKKEEKEEVIEEID